MIEPHFSCSTISIPMVNVMRTSSNQHYPGWFASQLIHVFLDYLRSAILFVITGKRVAYLYE